MINEMHAPARKIGRIVRGLRKERGLTGTQLGVRANLTQSQISKIENGYPPVNAAWVNNILNILNAPKKIRQQVTHYLSLELEHLPQAENREYVFTYFPQGYLMDIERKALHIRCFTVCVIPVLVQTVDYRMALSKVLGQSEEVAKEMLLRQDALWDADKNYHILVHEAALYTLFSTVQEHLAQLDRLDRILGLRAIKFGVIPVEAGVSVVGISNFITYDETVVLREVAEDTFETREKGVIMQYLNLFDDLSDKALYGAEAQQIIRKVYDYFDAHSPVSTDANHGTTIRLQG